MMTHDPATLEFYAREAAAYGARSDGIGVSKALGAFLALLPKGGKVLDLGCGTGRDTQAILAAGFDVTAIDGSAEMAAEARKRTGLPVLVMLFEELSFDREFDGVWASASLLHVPRAGLPDVLRRVHTALKPGGWLEAGFKSGGHEGRDSLGRYYNYMNPEQLEPMLRAAGRWSSLELRTGRGKGYDGTETGWVEVLARKSADAG
jgi:SAM-dependent methyltransferase